MNFQRWIQDIKVRSVRGRLDVAITDITCDSREVKPGCCFVALRGQKVDGLSFVPQALAQGATAIVSESHLEGLIPGKALVEVDDGRGAMAHLARQLFGKPDTKLNLIGVTGTNGKTTTTMIIRQLLRGAGIGCGLVGTVLNAAGAYEEEAIRTTPESPSFYRWLKRMVEAKDEVCACEVSSIGIELRRVAGAQFRAAVFTNLTQDHLDFHGDMETYYQAKRKLFAQLGPRGRAILNADDAYGRRLLEELPRAYTFGLDLADFKPAFRAEDLRLTPRGASFRFVCPDGAWELESPLLGRPNVSNLLAALAAIHACGYSLRVVLPALGGVKGAPGRLERVDMGQPFGVMIDYAHTPDALQKLIAEGRRMLPKEGRLQVLFGCGGDRDRTKRPLMASAVTHGADVIWHTSDNPRDEDPERILDDAAKGIHPAILRDPVSYHRIADRAEAVRQAVANCREGDLLLLAGKGHEPYQEILGVKHEYSDRTAVEASLVALGFGVPA